MARPVANTRKDSEADAAHDADDAATLARGVDDDSDDLEDAGARARRKAGRDA
jgi:hypothetical protein